MNTLVFKKFPSSYFC